MARCDWDAFNVRGGQFIPPKGLKGRAVSTLYILNLVARQFETRAINARTFRTNKDGRAMLEFEIAYDGPVDDGVAAWLEVRTRGLNTKKAIQVSQFSSLSVDSGD